MNKEIRLNKTNESANDYEHRKIKFNGQSNNENIKQKYHSDFHVLTHEVIF